DLEGTRVEEALIAGEQYPAEATDTGTDREGPQLELDRPYAHDLGRLLVLPDRQPRPADPAVVEVADREDGQDDDAQREPEIRCGIAYPEDRGTVGVLARRVRDPAGAAVAARGGRGGVGRGPGDLCGG